MGRRRKDSYNSGDQVHFILTRDFVEDYNEFVKLCDENSINVSTAIRNAIKRWLREEKLKRDQLDHMKESKSYKISTLHD